MPLRYSLVASFLLAAALLPVAPASATNTRAELERVREHLLDWLPGEYTSRPQLETERRHGAPPDGLHPDWYRIFARVDVPHIGEHVIYGQLHVGDRSEPIVPGTQVLYIITIDEERMAVNVSGRRIKDPGDYAFAHLDPEKLKTIALDPEYGGNCDFRWRLHGQQIVGWLAQPDEDAIDGTCSMVSKKSGLAMTWDAEWVLNADELWIYDNGYIDGEQLFMGRHDRTHTRLTKISPADTDEYTGARFRRWSPVVADIDETVRLFRDILGFELGEITTDPPTSYVYEVFGLDPERPVRHATFHAGEQQRVLSVVEVPGARITRKPGAPRMAAALFNANGRFDTIVAALREADYELLQPHRLGSNGIEIGFIDANGHLFALYEIPYAGEHRFD